MQDHAATPCNCPYCHYKVDRCLNISTAGPPKAGDFTLCIRCGNLSIFDSELKMRVPSEDDLAELAKSPENMQLVARARAAIRAISMSRN